jgi:hypothetical protein
MKTRSCLSFSLVFVLLSYFIPAASADSARSALSTGIEDQTGIAVTIYNVDLGLVKDQRKIKLPLGTDELRFMDVALCVNIDETPSL